jgi:sirohydrochlorin cobaltochelatase
MLGIVLLAHGSRDPLWRTPVEAVATRVRALEPQAVVCCAYLELAEPDLATAVDELAGAGASTLRVVPLFFGAGKHLRDDLPLLLRSLRLTHPGLVFEVLPALGDDPRLLDLIARNAVEGA